MSGDNLMTANAPADGRWRFDEGVAAAFEDMLERSIPNYQDMRLVTTRAAEWLLERHPAPLVVDLGASRGSAVAPLMPTADADNGAFFLLCDISEPMLRELTERFRGVIEGGRARVVQHDLRDGFPHCPVRPVVVLSVLTLQFVPVEYRHRLLAEAYDALEPGGGLILVEKVLGPGHVAGRMLVDLYHGLKRDHGYTAEAVERKRLALEGVLVPWTAAENVAALRDAGFATVECIWRYMNFAGWVAVKRGG